MYGIGRPHVSEMMQQLVCMQVLYAVDAVLAWMEWTKVFVPGGKLGIALGQGCVNMQPRYHDVERVLEWMPVYYWTGWSSGPGGGPTRPGGLKKIRDGSIGVDAGTRGCGCRH